MTGITYADLVRGAGARIAEQARVVRVERFDDRDQARQGLRDFHAVLDAIETHTWALIGLSRLAGISPAVRDDPVAADAISMVDGLRDLVGSDRPHPSILEAAERPWAQAALHLRGASDLLLVHLDHQGRICSPDAAVLGDRAARDAALVQVAGHLHTLLAGESTLGLRCLQVGVSKVEVTRWLPDLATNRTFTHHLATRTTDPHENGGLDRLRLIREPPRTHDPVLHAADLINQLRNATWALRTHPDYSVTTLGDLATAGLAIHAHTAAAHGTDLTNPTPTLTPQGEPFALRAVTWRNLRSDLTCYRAPGPPDPHVRADVLALRDLLARLAPLDGTGPTDPRVIPLLTADTTAAAQIATTAGQVFERLARSGHVHIHTRHLTGNHLGEDPDLITAKLTSTQVPAPQTRWQPTLDLWHTAARPVTPTPTPVIDALTHALDVRRAHVPTRIPLTSQPDRR